VGTISVDDISGAVLMSTLSDRPDISSAAVPAPADGMASSGGSSWVMSPTVAAGENDGNRGAMPVGDQVVFRAGSLPG
jgi:hypothetical protein